MTHLPHDRYEIRVLENGQHQVYDKELSVGLVPECHFDMAAYHAYLVGRGLNSQAQSFLASIIAGDKPIATMPVRVRANYVPLIRRNLKQWKQ